MPLNYRQSLFYEPLFQENRIQFLYQTFLNLYHLLNVVELGSAFKIKMLQEDEYTFLKLLSRMMSNFVCSQVCFKKNTSVSIGFETLLTFIWTLTSHSSKWILLESLEMLICIFKHEELKNSNAVTSMIPTLIDSLYINLTNVSFQLCVFHLLI